MAKISKHQDRTFVNEGIEIQLPAVYDELEESSLAAIEEGLADYPKAYKMFNLLVADPEVRANWDMADYIAVSKLSFNDHGEVHAKVAAASAVKLLQLLVEAGITPDVVSSGAGDWDDAFLVVVSAALLHDIGNQVHREEHAHWGVYLALPILNRLLPNIYSSLEKCTEIRGFILHAIHSHGVDPRPLTIEAALVAIADGTDMTKGRGRLAFDLGNVNIHTVSALSIDEVIIARGEETPVEINVLMSNSAGIFQVQETLGEKVLKGPLSGQIAIVATTHPEEVPTDTRIVHRIKIGGRD